MYKIFAFRYDKSSPGLAEETIAFMLDPGEDDINVGIDEDGSIYGYDAIWGSSLDEARELVQSTQHRAGAMYEINGNVEYEDLDEGGEPELEESDIVYLGSIGDIADGSWIVVSMPQVLRERAGAIGSDHMDRVALLDNSIITTIPGEVDLEGIMQMQPYPVINDDDYAFEIVPEPRYIAKLAERLEAGVQEGCELSGVDFCTVLWAWYRHHSDKARLPDWKTTEGIKMIVNELKVEDIETSLFS